MSILSALTEEERRILIGEMSELLDISISYNTDFDYYENRICGSIEVVLYFDGVEISRDRDSF